MEISPQPTRPPSVSTRTRPNSDETTVPCAAIIACFRGTRIGIAVTAVTASVPRGSSAVPADVGRGVLTGSTRMLGGAGGRNVVRQGRFVSRRARRALAAFKLRVMGDAFALADLTREEIRRTAGACTVVLPLGATEQHGTHLPVSVDTVVCERIATEAADLADGGPFLVAPALPYGV